VQTLATRNKQSSDPINTIRTQTRQTKLILMIFLNHEENTSLPSPRFAVGGRLPSVTSASADSADHDDCIGKRISLTVHNLRYRMEKGAHKRARGGSTAGWFPCNRHGMPA
jgi:hypothetical protein